MENYIDFETAKLLKEKGFTEPVRLWYDDKGDIVEKYIEPTEHEHKEHLYACPTRAQVSDWLQEKHDLYIEIHRFNKGWFYMIIDMLDDKTLFTEDCESFGECENDGLKYSLENLV